MKKTIEHHVLRSWHVRSRQAEKEVLHCFQNAICGPKQKRTAFVASPSRLWMHRASWGLISSCDLDTGWTELSRSRAEPGEAWAKVFLF